MTEPGDDEFDEIAQALWRAEHNVVAYDDDAIHAEDFASVDDARAWLNQRDVPFFVPFVVEAFDGDGWLLATSDQKDAPLFQGHQRDEGATELKKGWRPWRPSDTEAADWFVAGGNGGTATHWIQATAESKAVTEYAADYCWDRDELAAFLTDDFGHGDHFLAVGLEGTPTRIAFPREGSVLRLVVDDDGASMRLDVEWEGTYDPRAAAERAFRTKWAAWLDMDQPLDGLEVRRTIAHLEEAVGQLKSEEER